MGQTKTSLVAIAVAVAKRRSRCAMDVVSPIDGNVVQLQESSFCRSVVDGKDAFLWRFDDWKREQGGARKVREGSKN